VTEDGLQDPLRILLVEDEPANRVLLRAVLARAADEAIRSANLREAGTLAEARAALVDQKPELVVLDMRLPDGNGLDLAREVMSSGPGRPAVLILSASVLAPDRDAAVQAGADAFLGKPYSPADLLRTIQDLVENRGG
jgi:two-component system KDP operon response regulator KdpE